MWACPLCTAGPSCQEGAWARKGGEFKINARLKKTRLDWFVFFFNPRKSENSLMFHRWKLRLEQENLQDYTFVLEMLLSSAKVTQSCLTLCNPMDCSQSGSSVHGISQAIILVWVAISFSRGSSWSRDQIHISCIGRCILYHWATREY